MRPTGDWVPSSFPDLPIPPTNNGYLRREIGITSVATEGRL